MVQHSIKITEYTFNLVRLVKSKLLNKYSKTPSASLSNNKVIEISLKNYLKRFKK